MVLSASEYNLKITETNTEELPQETRQESLIKVFGDIKRRLEVAAKRNCGRYNLRRRYEPYSLNEPVYRRNYILSVGERHFTKKLAPKYNGPFYIHKQLSPWTYQLRDKTNKIWTVHGMLRI